jgi:hypothetical protein
MNDTDGSGAAPVDALAEELRDLIEDYWGLAWAEGRENRHHDTLNGDAQRVLRGINSAIDRLAARGDTSPAACITGGKTGWPPGLLQDDDKKLSKWLASKPDARLHAREAAAPAGVPQDSAPLIPSGEPPHFDLAGSQEYAPAFSAAARDVLAERRRQVEAEGWAPEHDDEHTDGSLADVAACYATHAGDQAGIEAGAIPWRNQALDDVPESWPSSWDESWWKPGPQRRNLIKAGALILAEIERLDRAAP